MNKTWRLSAAAFAVALGFWMAVDLSREDRHDLADFDPHAVARFETAMWKSYYAHERLRMFGQLHAMLRSQYRLGFWQSWMAAFHAARAAVIFQRGHGRADYELALPDLRRFYGFIRGASSVPFDLDDVARRELEWWIIHRERDRNPPGALEHALADLQAAIYLQPAPNFAGHAQARAEAMVLCDTGNAAGLVTPADWLRIQDLLDRSWSALKVCVRGAAK